MPADTAKYILHIADTNPENIEVIDFSGSDAVSSLYEFNINVRMSGAAKASKTAPLDKGVLGKPCRLDIIRSFGGEDGGGKIAMATGKGGLFEMDDVGDRVRMPTITSKALALISLVALVVISVTVFGCGHPWLAGITYPKKEFKFPSARDGEATDPQTFILLLDQSGNYPDMSVLGRFFVNKQYKVLHIKELRYEWEGNRGIFAKERKIRLWQELYVAEGDGYWYLWLGNFFECDFFKCNFAKLFVGKEPGDVFRLRLELVYSFDDEPENMQILEYNVEVYKGEYTSPFIGL